MLAFFLFLLLFLFVMYELTVFLVLFAVAAVVVAAVLLVASAVLDVFFSMGVGTLAGGLFAPALHEVVAYLALVAPVLLIDVAEVFLLTSLIQLWLNSRIIVVVVVRRFVSV